MSKQLSVNDAQIGRYRRDGFLLIPNAIPGETLTLWRKLALDLENRVKLNYQESSYSGKDRLILRQNQLLSVFPDALLDLLASPPLVEIASKLSGPGTVPLSSDLMYKRAGRESLVLWHQDAPHNRRFPYLNIGIYLDDSPVGDGCLRYVPGSQEKLQDVCGLTKRYGWNIPGAVDCPVKAGDIIVHDIMVLHSSKIKISDPARRTIYIEMRPVAAIVDQGVQSQMWAELRQRWMAMVRQRVVNPLTYPGLFENLPDDLGWQDDEISRITALKEPTVPASYCHESIDYDLI